ncbi:MAG: hypothetical protein V4617_04410, partial [Gemmatimonadota bacterium]
MPRPHRPADGERRATRGLVHQYRIGAALVLRALREHRLDWVRVADPDVGSVDDLVVGTTGHVEGLQVKWSRDPAPFPFSRLLGSTTAPRLWEGLAHGWRQLRAQFPERVVSVRLVSNDMPSTADRIPLAAGDVDDGRPRHFAAFLREAWRPAV